MKVLAVALPVVLVVIVAVAALANDASTAAPRPTSYSADVEGLFLKHCHSCHSTEEPRGDLVLDAGSGYGKLVSVPSRQVPSMHLVVPGDPEASYLWVKLLGTAEQGKGMPRTLFGAKKLPSDELELVRGWIASGAQP